MFVFYFADILISSLRAGTFKLNLFGMHLADHHLLSGPRDSVSSGDNPGPNF